MDSFDTVKIGDRLQCNIGVMVEGHVKAILPLHRRVVCQYTDPPNELRDKVLERVGEFVYGKRIGGKEEWMLVAINRSKDLQPKKEKLKP